MYSLRSKALLNSPQAAIESPAVGSRMFTSNRALACAIGTNSEPSGTFACSCTQRPCSVVR